MPNPARTPSNTRVRVVHPYMYYRDPGTDGGRAVYVVLDVATGKLTGQYELKEGEPGYGDMHTATTLRWPIRPFKAEPARRFFEDSLARLAQCVVDGAQLTRDDTGDVAGVDLTDDACTAAEEIRARCASVEVAPRDAIVEVDVAQFYNKIDADQAARDFGVNSETTDAELAEIVTRTSAQWFPAQSEATVYLTNIAPYLRRLREAAGEVADRAWQYFVAYNHTVRGGFGNGLIRMCMPAPITSYRQLQSIVDYIKSTDPQYEAVTITNYKLLRPPTTAEGKAESLRRIVADLGLTPAEAAQILATVPEGEDSQ